MPGVLTGHADRPFHDSNISNRSGAISAWPVRRGVSPRRHRPLVGCAESLLARYDPIGLRAGKRHACGGVWLSAPLVGSSCGDARRCVLFSPSFLVACITRTS